MSRRGRGPRRTVRRAEVVAVRVSPVRRVRGRRGPVRVLLGVEPHVLPVAVPAVGPTAPGHASAGAGAVAWPSTAGRVTAVVRVPVSPQLTLKICKKNMKDQLKSDVFSSLTSHIKSGALRSFRKLTDLGSGAGH